MSPHFRLASVVLTAANFCTSAAAQTLTTFSDQFNRVEGLEAEKLGPDWQLSSWANGWPFACTFSTRNVALYDNGDGNSQLNLSFDVSGSIDGPTCAETRTKNTFQYGNFYVSLQPSVVPGSVSSFFLYTGRSGTRTHFEIDIEFVPGSQIANQTVLPDNTGTDGKPPAWHLYTNYWVKGKQHPVWIDLERFVDPVTKQPLGINPFIQKREYSFIWEPKSISWWVNVGTFENKRWVQLRRAAVAINAKMPLMMNIWTGAQDNGWTGAFDPSNYRGMAQYDYVSVTTPKTAP